MQLKEVLPRLSIDSEVDLGARTPPQSFCSRPLFLSVTLECRRFSEGMKNPSGQRVCLEL